jgi:hypothetical protein
MLEYPLGEVTTEKWVAEIDKDNKLGAKKGQGQRWRSLPASEIRLTVEE